MASATANHGNLPSINQVPTTMSEGVWFNADTAPYTPSCEPSDSTSTCSQENFTAFNHPVAKVATLHMPSTPSTMAFSAPSIVPPPQLFMPMQHQAPFRMPPSFSHAPHTPHSGVGHSALPPSLTAPSLQSQHEALESWTRVLAGMPTPQPAVAFVDPLASHQSIDPLAAADTGQLHQLLGQLEQKKVHLETQLRDYLRDHPELLPSVPAEQLQAIRRSRVPSWEELQAASSLSSRQQRTLTRKYLQQQARQQVRTTSSS
jgi:hypothetical protein